MHGLQTTWVKNHLRIQCTNYRFLRCHLWFTNTEKSAMNYYIFTSHPPSITKQISAMNSKRISNISCDKDYFDKTSPDHNTAAKNSGFNENIKFIPEPPQRRKCSRNILWFNPPFSYNMKANIGKTFLRLIDKHSPKYHN